MEKLTDEELDSVFKNAAEGNAPPYDAAAWDAMTQKLDAPRTIPVWKKWTPFILIGTLLFISGVWVGRISSKEEQVRLVENLMDHAISETIENKSLQNQELIKRSEETETSIGDHQQNAILTKGKSDKKPTDKLRQETQQPNVVSVSRKGNESTKVFEEVVEPIADSLSNQEQKVVAQSILAAEVKADSSVLKPEVSTDSTEISKELEDKPVGGRVYGLFIRLLASPDLSSIKFGPTELGSNFGVIGEFSFTERFSVSTGIIRARKNYESYQEEAYGNSARHLVGSCTILDVPLNVTYYFPSQRKLSGYVTAGASSYLMLREDYIYTVKSSSGDRVYPYEAIRKNNEWFKVLNLAVGLQYQVTPRWHLQLEPFIKAPLADLGERNVRLSSIGVFGGLRYQLNSKK